MLISEVAETTGFAATTLRYYEDRGLLAPSRTRAGYRDYDQADVEALAFIARAKRLGLELDEVADLLALWRDGDCGRTREQVESLLASKLHDVQTELSELRTLQHQLEDAYTRTTSQPVPEVCGPGCGCPPAVPSASDREP